MNVLLTGEPYEALAGAIILQAVQDYRRVLHTLKGGYEWKAAAEKEELEKFFHSRWYGLLTALDPDYLMERLQKEAGDGEDSM